MCETYTEQERQNYSHSLYWEKISCAEEVVSLFVMPSLSDVDIIRVMTIINTLLLVLTTAMVKHALTYICYISGREMGCKDQHIYYLKQPHLHSNLFVYMMAVFATLILKISPNINLCFLI